MKTQFITLYHRHEWLRAAVWGFGASLLQRILLGVWMALVWLTAGPFFNTTSDFQTPDHVLLPPLQGVEIFIFGVWRRWDAIHYLYLSQVGYGPSTIDLTVFPPLAPLSIQALNALLPGGPDFAGLVFASLSTGLLLTFLYRLTATCLNDEELACYAVGVMSLFPLAHFFAAPMPDAIHLAMVIAAFYYTYRQQYGWAGLAGALAGFARTQGALLIVPLAVLAVQQHWQHDRSLVTNLRVVARKAYLLMLVPLGALAFMAYRWYAGFPSMDIIYRDYSYSFFTNPLEGYLINLRWYLQYLPELIGDPNLWALVLVPLGIVGLFFSKAVRQVSFLVYCILLFGLFVSGINYRWGTDTVWATQSLGRYSLALFPLILLVADQMRRRGKVARLIISLLLIALTLMLSARHVLGLLGP